MQCRRRQAPALRSGAQGDSCRLLDPVAGPHPGGHEEPGPALQRDGARLVGGRRRRRRKRIGLRRDRGAGRAELPSRVGSGGEEHRPRRVERLAGPAVDRGRHLIANGRELRVEHGAGAGGIRIVAVTADIVRRDARAGVRIDVRADTVRVEVVLRGEPGEQLDERCVRRSRRGLRRECAHERDADRALVVVLGVAAGHREPIRVVRARELAVPEVARVAALVDPPLLVDQVVVADVRPAPGNGVVVVDRAYRGRRIGVVVAARRVVDHQLLKREVLPRPLLVSGGVKAKALVGSPLGTRDDGWHRGRTLGDRSHPERKRLRPCRIERQDSERGEGPIGVDADDANRVDPDERAIRLVRGDRPIGRIVSLLDLDRPRRREGLPVLAERRGHQRIGMARPVDGDVGRIRRDVEFAGPAHRGRRLGRSHLDRTGTRTRLGQPSAPALPAAALP